MDLNFYPDLSDASRQHLSTDFLDASAFGGYGSVSKLPGGSDCYVTISGAGHPFLCAEQTFHTPSLGDEEFEIPPISLDAGLSVEDMEAHFRELAAECRNAEGPVGSSTFSRCAADSAFVSVLVPPPSHSLEPLSMSVLAQSDGGALSSTLGIDLVRSVGQHFTSSSPVTIDVPLSEMTSNLQGFAQLATIDQSELNLGLGGAVTATCSRSVDPLLCARSHPAEDGNQGAVVGSMDCPLNIAPPAAAAQPLTVPTPPTMVRIVEGKPAVVPASGVGADLVLVKRGRKKKDPNEPQKPVSAYALFFRDTQAAIKGQNPRATFGEVSRIVASMWDSLGEEQKKVYRKKTEAAKKEYLKALAAYRANDPSKPFVEVLNPPSAVHPGQLHPSHHMNNSEQNKTSDICMSSIILDVPRVTTRSQTGALPPGSRPPVSLTPTVTKFIISKQMVQADAQIHSVSSSVMMVGAVQPSPAHPSCLSALPCLQAKPGGLEIPLSVSATAPTPLQIKFVPAALQADVATPVTMATTPVLSTSSPLVSFPACSPPSLAVREEFPSTETEVEVDACAEEAVFVPSMCVRAGCTNPAVESMDWNKEYCSNECVVSHCRDVFMAWCSFRSQNSTTVS
ncbi:epidermal Langerhans cell protein LCP1-like isoform X2 [Denticeps clupeoides]|uniref:epidermal Langerhans cell protein LCP1-like isoform X2 n=1 Tax=Denticeps clupeoides TaxID=299321 RepID=UPI0010A2B726|nr:TOX high mobility group box family member 4-A-like isoform X2 [Denticeps clupeoides]